MPASEHDLRLLPWQERFASLKDLAPALFLILCVLRSMYGGIATPSEAAAVGVLGAALVTAFQGSLSAQVCRDVLIGSVMTCSMIALIVLGASILGNTADFLGIPQAVAAFVQGLQLSPFMLIIALIVFYLILGCFLDGFSMIVLTLPIVQRHIAGNGPTFTMGATPFLDDLADHVERSGQGTPSLRIFSSTGAPIPRALVSKAKAALGASIISGWGMPETAR